jgi:hypothetical protein
VKEEAMEERETLVEKRKDKIKETLLDETYKKAELTRSLRSSDKDPEKKTYKKVFPKFGFVLIVFAIIGIIIINSVPWAYIEYGAENEATSVAIYKDFRLEGSNYTQIYELFQSPYYIGLSTSDFSEGAKLEYYGCISMVILGIIIIIFGIIDKTRNFSGEFFAIVHFIIGTITILPGMFIVLSATKFLGAQFLSCQNALPAMYTNLSLLFPTPFILIILGFVIIRLAFTIMKIDFNKIQETKEEELFEDSFSSTVYGDGNQ